MPLLVAILYLMLCLTPAMVSAQDSSAVFRAVVEDIYNHYDSDSMRLVKFRAVIDSCTSNADAEALSYEFLDVTEKRGSLRNLAFAYMYTGYFSSNNGDVVKGLDLSFKKRRV